MRESLFYDTGYKMDPNSWNWDTHRIEKEIDTIANTLKIDRNKYHDNLIELIENATYGGYLVIYFLEGEIDTFHEFHSAPDITIKFQEPNIAVIDTEGGSGFNIFLENITIELPYKKDHIHKDSDIPYPYVTEICGMVSDWCKDTKVYFGIAIKNKQSIPNSDLNLEIEMDNDYQKTFDAGGCTFGDMHMNRHRNTIYINSYPCGTKCTDCNTFWID